MPSLQCNEFITNGNIFKLCDIGGKIMQIFSTTTPELINLKNSLIILLTAVGAALIAVLTKKVYETIKKTWASKAIEENVFHENIASIINNQSSTNIPAYDLEQVIDWNNNKI